MQKISFDRKLQACAVSTARSVSALQRGTPQFSLSPALVSIVTEVQREICREEDDDGAAVLSSTELDSTVQRTAAKLGFELGAHEKNEVLAAIEREQKPFGVLQALIDDERVSDVIVSGYSRVSVQQGRRNYSTNLNFPSPEAYEAYVERLLLRAGSAFSTRKPIADGMLGSFARIHAVHKALCETGSGPYLTIRLNRFSRVDPSELAARGLAPRAVLNYLQGMIRCGMTLLIAGEVGTGKTTLARALAGTIPADESILVIEDTPEINLEHPQVRYITTRESNTDGAGRVTPAECIRAGMRMAMNRIIFGEMRDAEAAEAFIDVCASGHPGLSTIHARSAAEAVSRLELFLGRAQRGVGRNVLTEQIANAVQAIVFVDVCRISGRRRIVEVREIGPVADGVMRQREIFRYQFQHGEPAWKIAGRVSAHREALEQLESAVVLSSLPPNLELDPEVLLGEAADQASRAA